jgi:hypothetical protein
MYRNVDLMGNKRMKRVTNKFNKKILISAVLLALMGTAQAELSGLQRQVIADHNSMQNMNTEQRRAFRQQIWNNSDKVAQRAYNRAYKAMVEAGMIGQLSATNKTSNPNRVPMTSVSYHSGALTAAVPSSVMIGNRFNTGGLNPLEMSGSITMFTANIAAASGNVFFSFYDQLAGTTANQITSMSTPMIAGQNTITLATELNYTGNEFLGGIWNFGGDSANLAAGTVGGQGFHAVQINDGNPGMSFATIANMNGAFGVGGNLTTPVELMNFSID